MVKIRTAELYDAAALTVIFCDDLGEPDCTEEMVAKKLPLVDPKRECVFVAEDDAGQVCGKGNSSAARNC